jgi:hypothetical protein
MLKINHIQLQDNFRINCRFNNGISKTIDIKPLLEKHKHLPGIEKLKDKKVFFNARIGSFGEIVWDNIIQFTDTPGNEPWNYDISPEFVYYNGITA